MNELSIVIPCVSSMQALRKNIDGLAIQLMSNPSEVDVIVVSNDDVDYVEQLANEVSSKYPWLKFELLLREGGRRCYGALARFGIAYSSSRYVVIVSPDGENDVSMIPKMLNAARNGAQVVQATRYSSIDDARRVPRRFRAYQTIYRFLTKMFLGHRISDSTYGFKIFDRVFIQAMGLSQNGYSISPEITFKTLLASGVVEYIPSQVKTAPVNKDFKLYGEGLKYAWLLIRGLGHRIGILWF